MLRQALVKTSLLTPAAFSAAPPIPPPESARETQRTQHPYAYARVSRGVFERGPDLCYQRERVKIGVLNFLNDLAPLVDAATFQRSGPSSICRGL